MCFFINQNKYKVILDIIKEFMRVFNILTTQVLLPKKEGVKTKCSCSIVFLPLFAH